MQEPGYVTQTDLKKIRGWTDWMIREFLGSPDKELDNNFGKKTKLYLICRIELAERSPEFKKRLPEIWHLRRQAEKAIKTKRHKTEEWAIQVPIEIKKLSMAELYKQALSWHEVKDFSKVHETLAKRWMVNYLRHQCTAYDGLTTQGLYRKIGRDKAYQIIRERTLMLIINKYPVLAEAAKDQIIRYKGGK